jgi:hypothetical protein
MSPAPLAANGLFIVVVPEEEAVGALLAAEDAAHAAPTALVAHPLEADGTLVEALLLVVDVTGDTVHRDGGPMCRREYSMRVGAA